MWGTRVVVPTKLRERVLEELHQGHSGVVRMKALARSYVWWPSIDKAVEECAKKCASCQANRHAPAKAPLHPWVWRTVPWERVHIDFAGPMMGKMLFVAVDAHSKWPEVCVMGSTTSSKTISVLRDVFARFGLPRQRVSDNGPQFTSSEFKEFLTSNGVKHITTSPYHPSSNGAAECFVQTIKQAIRAGHQKGVSLEHILTSFLLQYRVTPHATTGASPSALFMGRSLRTRLDLLRPDVGGNVRDQQASQKDRYDGRSASRRFEIDQTVWVRNYREGPRWVQGKVVDQVGPLSYHIQLPSGDLWRCHVDQLRAGRPREPDTADAGSVPEEPNEEVYSPSLDPTESVAVDRDSSTPAGSPSEDTPIDTSSGSRQPSTPTSARYPSRIRRPPDRLYHIELNI